MTSPIHTLDRKMWANWCLVMSLHFTSCKFCYKNLNFVDQFLPELS